MLTRAMQLAAATYPTAVQGLCGPHSSTGPGFDESDLLMDILLPFMFQCSISSSIPFRTLHELGMKFELIVAVLSG